MSDLNDSKIQRLRATSYLSGNNAAYLEDLYEDYLKDPSSVDGEWQTYFKSMLPNGASSQASSQAISHADVRQQFIDLAQKPFARRAAVAASGPVDALQLRKQVAVKELIDAYRANGHLASNINPLPSDNKQPPPSQLSLASYPVLASIDQSQVFEAEGLLPGGKGRLKEILEKLAQSYCGTTGIEYMHIRDEDERAWWRHHFEQGGHGQALSTDEKLATLKLLTAAEGMERYLASKYVGQKRFSLEGGESFIPFIHMLNEQAAARDVKEVVVGMAHRGRLSVLINIFGHPPQSLFEQFEGRKDYGDLSSDVKYHLGHASDIDTPSGPLHLALAFNPSHLEIIAPVIMGSVRARQQRQAAGCVEGVMGVVVHGDAAMAGQGIVMETLSMSQTDAYNIGGVVHIVINNQVGFTTSKASESRSSTYCTDIAKMIDAPVIHVNGDDPEAVVRAARLAADYRQKFHKDIFVDLVCYRRLGHNEADEPAATQPAMYRFIRQHPTTRELYAQKLVAEKVCTDDEVNALVEDYRNRLDSGKPVVEVHHKGRAKEYGADWLPYTHQDCMQLADTTVPQNKLIELAERLRKLPEGFEVQRQVSHTLQARIKMGQGEQPMDWGYAETMAYASLVDQGYAVRMSGQDCQRGTFAHRHAVLHDQQTGETYTPLANISKHQAPFQIYNSLLSEAGSMGFEYGYASTEPKTLTIWEAQYGDFANGAQVIVDQFMSSAWQKWGTLSGLTLLLPHGYEGAGPEHTSARLERYLQLCAQGNMQVCMPTTPAQIFHLLRRQVIRPCRIPLVVMTPKSLLRNKLAVSSLEELSHGGFQLVIPEIDKLTSKKITRVVLCSGKVYYDLLVQRREQQLEHVALIRVEQLYPFPVKALAAELAKYKQVKDIVWCQEEPENQGSWYVLRDAIASALGKDQMLRYVGRAASASPAAGYMKLHLQTQKALVDAALAP
ncbi:MAG: sucA [Gammaproteobacteria bacterium]|jgi:2-oxoglutarate dehydrogenase E1 component|nr:sucA [Gammaproteobacteria bacterium]